MNREVNTIGSKSNDFELQKCVVVIKENLEKLKSKFKMYFKKGKSYNNFCT